MKKTVSRQGAILTRQRRSCDAWRLYEANPKDSKEVNPSLGCDQLESRPKTNPKSVVSWPQNFGSWFFKGNGTLDFTGKSRWILIIWPDSGRRTFSENGNYIAKCLQPTKWCDCQDVFSFLVERYISSVVVFPSLSNFLAGLLKRIG